MLVPTLPRNIQVLLRRAGTPKTAWGSSAPQLFKRRYAAAAAALNTTDLENSPLGFATESSAVLHRTLKSAPLQVVAARGTNVKFSNGQTMEDTTCGAGVACIGYNNERVKNAMVEQIDKFSYCNSMFFGTPIGEQLAANLIEGTNGEMAKAYIMCSGESLR